MDRDPSSSASRTLTNSGRSTDKKETEKKEKKQKKDKDKKQKKLKKDKSKEISTPEPPARKVMIRDPADAPPDALCSSPSTESRIGGASSSVKEPEPSPSPQASSPLLTDSKLTRGSLPGSALTISEDSSLSTRPSPPHSPSTSSTLGLYRTASQPLSVADAIELEAQLSLTRSLARPPSSAVPPGSPSLARSTNSALTSVPSGSPKSRRTPSLSRADQIIPVQSGSLRRAPSDPELSAQLHSKAELQKKEKDKDKDKDKSTAKRFSRIVLGGLSQQQSQQGAADADARELPDMIGSLVIQLQDAHGLKGLAEFENFVPGELNVFCVFRVGSQEGRSAVASKGGPVWNEYLNLLCESGADLLTLDVYEYINVNREAIIGSSSVELKHLLLGGFSDEWNEYSLRVDKDSGALVNFRCCFKPFVGAQRSKEARDIFGFELPEKVIKQYKDLMPAKLKADAERQRSLNRVFNWHHPKVLKDLKKHTRLGIPIAHRPEVWMIVSGAKKRMEAHPGLYHKLLQENASRTTAHTIQIDKDLHRTPGNHHLYMTVEGRSALRRILVAYSWKNAGLGYCQAMSFIAAILLLFIDEEAVFWLLATIVEDMLPDYFTRYLIGSKADVQLFKEIAREKLPRLMSHFQKIDYELSLLLQPWFLCLFNGYLPTRTLLRVIDAFLLEGSKVLFRVSLALLKMNEDALLATRTFEEAHNLMKDVPSMCFDSDKLMKVAFKDLGSLFSSSTSEKMKVARDKLVRHYMETVKLADFRWLDGKTKFDQENLETLHQQFKAVALTKADGNEDSSYLTLEAFEALMFGSLEDRTPTSTYIFKAFDTNRDQVVDFREFTIGLHVLTKGTPDEKIKFFFASFDDDGDGYLTADQLSQLMNMQFLVLKQNDLTPSQKQLIVKNLVAKSPTGKLSFPEFRAAISEVSLLDAALQLAATTRDPAAAGGPSSSGTPSPTTTATSEKASLPISLSTGSANADRLESAQGSSPPAAAAAAAAPSEPLSRSRKNSKSGEKGMRRSRSHFELNQLDSSKRGVKYDQAEVVVSNPLWRKAGSVLPVPLKRDKLDASRSGQFATERGFRSGGGGGGADDYTRTSPRGGTSSLAEFVEKRMTARGGALTKTKSSDNSKKSTLKQQEMMHFEPLACLDHLTIDLSHLTHDQRLRASRDFFANKAAGAQPPVSVAVSTTTASSGLRTSDKALTQSAAEALRTSKGLRSSDSALHTSVRNLAAATAAASAAKAPEGSAPLRTSRSSDDLRKAVIDTGLDVPQTGSSGQQTPVNPNSSTGGSGNTSLTNSGKDPVGDLSLGTPPRRSSQSAAADAISHSPPVHITTSSRTSRSGSDLPPRFALQEVASSGSGSSPGSSGQNSPVAHVRRASGGTPVVRIVAKKDSEEQQQAPAPVRKNSGK